ncbi:MAG: 2Fe-2S iron-sulfur cluster-binding protein [Bdellovibrionota bacterium]
MPKVIFHLSDKTTREVEVPTGTKVTQAAYLAEVHIEQTCGGTPSCTDCTIKVLKEEAGGSLEEMQGNEKRLLGNVYHITHERLACQSVIKGSVSIEVPFIEVKKREERE